MGKQKIVVIVGPTAAGKSSLALDLARRFHGEIISADSVQVYRRLDIGTAKPSPAERQAVRHHLIDILNPDEDYSAALFREQAEAIIRILNESQTPAFIVGGTGLYLKALTRGLFSGPGGDRGLRRKFRRMAEENGPDSLYAQLQEVDPQAAARIAPQDTFRVIRALEVFSLTRSPISRFQNEHRFREQPYRVFKIGLWIPRDELYRRIESRVERMLAAGWVDEVRSLLREGYSPHVKPLQSVGYRELVSYISGEISLDEATHLIKQSTRRYAKRQLTWFRADPEVNWVSEDGENYKMVGQWLENYLASE